MREVKRKAEVGEKVKVVNAHNIPETAGKPDYKNGSILEIVRMLDDYAGYSTECGKLLYEDEYVVLEGENEMRFKVGDIVKVVENVNMHRFEIGEFIRITNVTDFDYRAESLGGTEAWWVIDRELEPVLFTLSDLKPCMVVKIRNSQFLLVSRLESGLGLVDEREQKSLYFDDFNDDLTFKPNSNLDIIEVYGYRKDYIISSLELSSVRRELLWKREEHKPKRKMTVAEICKELGEEIEIVEGE